MKSSWAVVWTLVLATEQPPFICKAFTALCAIIGSSSGKHHVGQIIRPPKRSFYKQRPRHWTVQFHVQCSYRPSHCPDPVSLMCMFWDNATEPPLCSDGDFWGKKVTSSCAISVTVQASRETVILWLQTLRPRKDTKKQQGRRQTVVRAWAQSFPWASVWICTLMLDCGSLDEPYKNISRVQKGMVGAFQFPHLWQVTSLQSSSLAPWIRITCPPSLCHREFILSQILNDERRPW